MNKRKGVFTARNGGFGELYTRSISRNCFLCCFWKHHHGKSCRKESTDTGDGRERATPGKVGPYTVLGKKAHRPPKSIMKHTELQTVLDHRMGSTRRISYLSLEHDRVKVNHDVIVAYRSTCKGRLSPTNVSIIRRGLDTVGIEVE